MNRDLERLAANAGIDEPESEPLRLAFGLACAERVGHLLEDERARDCLAQLRDFVAGRSTRAAVSASASLAAAVAAGHRGSGSVDGSAHAAVSATYALRSALAGRAIEAANYAAYAAVYAYGSYAIGDPSAFEGEFAWQIETFETLSRVHPGRDSDQSDPARQSRSAP